MKKKLNEEEIKNKLIKIIKGSKYIIEFIVALLFLLTLYMVITVKAYAEYISVPHLVISIISGLALLVIMIINCKIDYKKIENIFLNFTIPVGLMFIVFMLPTYTADSSSHLWKAYEVSNGIFLTRVEDNTANTTEVPVIMSENDQYTLNRYYKLNTLLSNEEAEDYSNTGKVNSTAMDYSFIFYLGYAIGLWIARILSINIFKGLIIARITNFIIVLVMQYYAIKKIPFGKLFLCAYLMIPMMIHQTTAFTADSIMNASIILFISYTLFLAFSKEKITWKKMIILIPLSMMVGIAKMPYLPMIGIILIIAKRRKDISKKHRILIIVAMILMCMLTFSIYSICKARYKNLDGSPYEETLEEAGVDSEKQVEGILKNPLKYIKVLCNTSKYLGNYYLVSSIASCMGWLSIGQPNIYVWSYIILMLVAIYVEDNDEVLDKREKAFMILMALGVDLLIVTGLYIEWTGLGELYVDGVQGRYFLPTRILIFLSMCPKHNFIKIKSPNIFVPMMSFIINSLCIIKVIEFFL